MKNKRKYVLVLSLMMMLTIFNVNNVVYMQESTIKIGSQTFDTLQEAVNSSNNSIIELVGSFHLNDNVVIEENKDVTIQGGQLTMDVTATFLTSGQLTLSNLSIDSTVDAGKAPITLNRNNAVFKSENLNLKCSGPSAKGYSVSQQAIQVDINRDSNISPDAVEIELSNSFIQMDGSGARGISFAGKSEGTKIKINDSKILNGYDSMNEWKGGESRGISLFDTKDVKIDITNSQLSGWQYAINSGGDTTVGLDENNLIINVDNSTLCGWTGFNIWTPSTVLNIINDSHILGINGNFNSDKKYTFSAIVINDDIYDNGWGSATNNTVKIVDSTIEARTLDGMPEETLIRIDNSNNFKLEVLGNSKLINNLENPDLPFALDNEAMESNVGQFIKEKIIVDSSVELIGGFEAFAYDHVSKTKYNVVLKLETDENKGSVSVSNEFKGKLIQEGNYVKIIATPKANYQFVGWYDINNHLVSSKATDSILATKNQKIIAKFEKDLNVYFIKNIEKLELNKKKKLDLKVENNINDLPIKWNSNRTDVVTVDALGNVTAKDSGTATITVTVGDKTASCTVSVYEIVAPVIPPVDKDTNVSLGEEAKEVLKDVVKDVIDNVKTSTAISNETREKLETALAAGKEISVAPKVEVKKESAIEKEVVTKIENAMKATTEKDKVAEVAQYYDLSMMLTAAGEPLGTVNELTGKVEFTVSIPKDLTKAGRKFYMVRVHGNGDTERIEGKLDGTDFSFETDKFSIFALVYEDDKVETPTTPEKPGVDTGDVTDINTLLVLLTMAGIVVVYGAMRYRKENR